MRCEGGFSLENINVLSKLDTTSDMVEMKPGPAG